MVFKGICKLPQLRKSEYKGLREASHDFTNEGTVLDKRKMMLVMLAI